MAGVSLKAFKASELAAALGETLQRGRPSKAQREDLIARVTFARTAGEVAIRGGKLVRIEQ